MNVVSSLAAFQDNATKARDISSLTSQTALPDLSESELELTDVVDTLTRATSIIKKEMTENLVLLQQRIDVHGMNSIVTVLAAVIDATAVSFEEKQKLEVMAQGPQSSNVVAVREGRQRWSAS